VLSARDLSASESGGDAGEVEHSEAQQISVAETERMKVQEVILKTMAGSLKWWEAAEIIGVSDRTMRRWRQRAVRSTEAGAETQESADGDGTRVVGLYRGRYFDFNVRHFHAKLREDHGLSITARG
jgi:hypothetical protein